MSEWQPIETAPKDSSNQLILYDLDLGVCTGFWIDGDDEFSEGWEVSDGVSSYYGEDAAVTHWMPFPNPPEEV